jgi:hypothetical protein
MNYLKRSKTLHVFWGLIFIIGLTFDSAFAEEASLSLKDSIKMIGNQEHETQKLRLLHQLKDYPAINTQQLNDLNNLIKEIERWNNSPRLEYFSRKILDNNDWDFNLSQDSSFESLTWFYRARMIIWVSLEYGGIWSHDEEFQRYVGKAKQFLNQAHKSFPENKLIAMYLGESIPSPEYDSSTDAPEWAVYQREGLQRLSEIIHWWIDNRLQENGEYGGGWGDDCEMWRWWIPVLIGFDDPKISKAQEFFSTSLLNQPHMKGGYTSRMSDVEHTAEDSSDAMTPMMHLDPDNPLWRNRALRLVDLMENLWTGVNQRGFLQFKSTYFTSEKNDLRTERACDSVYHPRAMQPALLYWQRTQDKRLTDIFGKWMDVWVDATTRAERGKPAGIIPSAIHWPSGTVGGTGNDWWKPENYKETLYNWPSAMSMMLHTLLQTHLMTGSESYLEPIRSMAQIRLNYLNNPPANTPQLGSETWCAQRINLKSVLTKYRFFSGSDEFDDLLVKENDPYYTFRLTHDISSLTKSLRRNAEALSINFPGYTEEVRYTDRYVRFPAFLQRCGWSDEDIQSPNPMLLYASATGDPGDALYFPLNRVRWLTPAFDIAALVTDANEDKFVAQLFHFGSKPRRMGAELYMLNEGVYHYEVKSDAGEVFDSGEFTVSGAKQRIHFAVPSKKLCRVVCNIIKK